MLISIHSDMRDYEITLQSGALEYVGQILNLNRKALIVTDSGVPEKYSKIVAKECSQPFCVCVPAGERSKSMQQFQMLLSEMLKNGFTRADCVVAVGGGVVGDLSAFAASCYMRGIDFYNIPTTLLSQVDSSIGGKTAVNFNGVKNIVGTFYQPSNVVIDPLTLETLDDRQLHAGLAEIIKMAATSDADLFELLEQGNNPRARLQEIIYRALLIKKSVVEQDPTERGIRRVLNFGHTVGHAIESSSNGKLLHGECVALGMLPMCSVPVRERLIKVLHMYDLPSELTQKSELLMPYLLHDKKKKADSITTVVVDEIGSYSFMDMLPEEIIARVEDVG